MNPSVLVNTYRKKAIIMERTKNIVSLDCGNSSFRVVLGKFDGIMLTSEVVYQVPNEMVRIGDYFYWDFLNIFQGFTSALKRILGMVDRIDSIGICTWGVDFALYDKCGNMLGNPLSYRNTIGEQHLSRLSVKQQKELFHRTGILCDKINSIYMLEGIRENMPEIFSVSDKLLMVPDILNYMLTGIMVNEPSELSTTQMMDARTREICPEVCGSFKIPETLFCEIGCHGKEIGKVRRSILDELEIDYDIPVICVPSHDTASAVVAIPSAEKNFAFISSGTWSLIGTELDEPIINEEVRESSLTNEVGAFGKITLLKNSAGMFIIQRIKKEFDAKMNRTSSWNELDKLAEGYQGEVPLFDINGSRFFNPPKMGEEIWSFLCETNQAAGEINWGVIVKAVHESMACCYAFTIANIEKITGKKFECIYIVGGGSENTMVNSLTSRRTGKKVIACSKESTALGNIAVQLHYFDPDLDLCEIRRIISRSIDLKKYSEPFEDSGLVERYIKLTK